MSASIALEPPTRKYCLFLSTGLAFVLEANAVVKSWYEFVLIVVPEVLLVPVKVSVPIVTVVAAPKADPSP